MNQHEKSAIFPETLYKAGWSKEGAIDALFQKAGYWKPRKGRADTAAPPSTTIASLPGETGVLIDHATDPENIVDPVVSRTAVIFRFETVSFRMGFRKYQRAKAAAASRGRELRHPG
ncbi:unnamed protein product [Hapterophycus canaliculatus]